MAQLILLSKAVSRREARHALGSLQAATAGAVIGGGHKGAKDYWEATRKALLTQSGHE